MSQVRAVGALLGILLVAVVGAYVGSELARRATAPEHVSLVLTTPDSLAGPAVDPLVSPGGFTGFGGAPALGGTVLRVGIVEELPVPQDGDGDGDDATATPTAAPGADEATPTPTAGPGGEFAVRSGDGLATIRFSAPTRLFWLRPLQRDIAVGDVLLVRYDGTTPAGVLVVPADLEEGTGSSLTPSQRRGGG